MTTPRPVVLDASLLDLGDADASARRLATRLRESPVALAGLVRIGRGGPETLRADTGRMAAPDLAALHAWLLGEGPRPQPGRAGTGGSPARRGPAPAIPAGAALLKPGLRGWDDPAFAAWLRTRPDLSLVAYIETPVALDWPEYAVPAEALAWRQRLAALAARAGAILVPDLVTRDALVPCLPARWEPRPPIVAEPPSALAGGDGQPFDAALAAVPFFLAIDRIEARANTAMLLHVWRAMLAAGGPVPRLILAGDRGEQVEELGPLLAWNPAIADKVVEAPGLTPATLRHLALHARALLAPAFCGGSAALLRDAGRLGVPVIAAGASPAPASGSLRLLDPLDGCGWHAAIRDASSVPARGNPVSVALDGAGALARIVALAAAS